jgi:NADPH2:quinone reductase
MKALVVKQFGALDALAIEERPAPGPGAGEVLVDVRAAGVNFPDLLVIGGTYQHLPPLPFIPGKECAGVVKAVGSCVTLVKPGDRVMVQIEHGAFAQQVVAQQINCHAIPDSMDFPSAAALGLTYMTAHFALVERAGLKPGEVVLVTGAAGGVGLATVQIAKALGATVLAAVSSPDKAAVARASGADHIIDVSVPDLKNKLREQVFAAVGKRGADVILDNVGGDIFDAALRAIAWSGRMLVIGFTSGRIPEIKAGLILVKNISVIGMQISDYRDRQPEKFRAVRQQLLDMCSAGKLKPHVMATFPLERYAEALALVKDRKVIGKVVLTTR